MRFLPRVSPVLSTNPCGSGKNYPCQQRPERNPNSCDSPATRLRPYLTPWDRLAGRANPAEERTQSHELQGDRLSPLIDNLL